MTTRLIAETHRGTGTVPVGRGLAILVSAIVMLIPLHAQRAEAVSDAERPTENLVGRWKKTGVGVHHEGGRVWITQLFCR